jgi:4-amino-4-deoxy-L-arabinose transferase-like glycosyltransferase
MNESQGIIAFCNRRYVLLASAVLGLAAFNLLFRLGSEIITEWDESLYAITASEIVASGHWIGTTFMGSLDYYNTKPPLNVWFIALAFKAFGTNLWSLRLASVLSAWLTVALLQEWSRRSFGRPVALLASLVLATTFGFLYVHAARSANTDALFTLLILLTVVTLWAAEDRRWRLVWLGPIAAAVFLLRGMAVLMPIGIVSAEALLMRRSHSKRWLPIIVALLLFLVPVAVWVIARWQVDGWLFFERMLSYDLWARSVTTLETHRGGPLYYTYILCKHHYDWLLAGLVGVILFPVRWSDVRAQLRVGSPGRGLAILILSWAGVALVMPTLMVTKVPWYLNPFYPVFALGIAWLVVRALSKCSDRRQCRAWAVLAFVAVLASGVAESKLWWYSFRHRDLSNSVQGLLLDEGNKLTGHRVFRNRWDRAEMFIIRSMLDAERGLAVDVDDFFRQSQPGDYLVTKTDLALPGLSLARSQHSNHLYHRSEASSAK